MRLVCVKNVIFIHPFVSPTNDFTMNASQVKAELSALNFTAIDVETANEQRDSLCCIGLVSVQQGTIVEEVEYRIRPRELRVSIINSQIHKLTEQDLHDQPEIRDVWPQIASLMEEHPVVAHNASFDIDVLQQSLRGYGMAFPRVRYLCSLKVAHVAFPGLPSYRLKDLASSFGIVLDHHNATSDAKACARITVEALPRIDPGVLDWHADELTARMSKPADGERRDPWDDLFGAKKIDSTLLKPNLNVDNMDNPFYNKKVVFTGDLESMEREVAAQLIQALGADINVAISKRTHIVILGRAPGPSKMKKVEALMAQGCDIRLMNEKEFLGLLGRG